VSALGFIDSIRQWEGLKTWMYRDKIGYVTTGLGNLLHNVDEAQALPWRAVPWRGVPWRDDLDQPVTAAAELATPDEVRVAFDRVASSPYLNQSTGEARPALSYRDLTDIRLTEQAAVEIATRRLEREFLPGIRKLYPAFDTFTPAVKGALVYIAWNTGVHGLANFDDLHRAIDARDWPRAARCCHLAKARDKVNDWLIAQFAAGAKMGDEVA